VFWNSMIAGYAQHGIALQATGFLKKWKGKVRRQFKPRMIEIIGVLDSLADHMEENESWCLHTTVLTCIPSIVGWIENSWRLWFYHSMDV
jgi:hypothetical protein